MRRWQPGAESGTAAVQTLFTRPQRFFHVDLPA
jgi:hypothetical protein